jgi:hypothetical protein
MVFKATFNNISAIAWSSVYCCLKQEYREKTNDLSQITDKLDHIVLHRVHLAMKGVSTLEVKGSDCTCSYKSNYIANMTTTVLLKRILKRNNTYQTGLYNYLFLCGCLVVCLFVFLFCNWLFVCLVGFLLLFFFVCFCFSSFWSSLEFLKKVYDSLLSLTHLHAIMIFFHFTIGSFHWVLRFFLANHTDPHARHEWNITEMWH